MSGELENPPSFYWSFERFWEILSILTLALGILVWLLAPIGSLTVSDAYMLVFISMVCALQAIYYDRKVHQAARKQT